MFGLTNTDIFYAPYLACSGLASGKLLPIPFFASNALPVWDLHDISMNVNILSFWALHKTEFLNTAGREAACSEGFPRFHPMVHNNNFHGLSPIIRIAGLYLFSGDRHQLAFSLFQHHKQDFFLSQSSSTFNRPISSYRIASVLSVAASAFCLLPLKISSAPSINCFFQFDI